MIWDKGMGTQSLCRIDGDWKRFCEIGNLCRLEGDRKLEMDSVSL